MFIDQQILSDVTVHMKYAKYIPELGRRETWTELVDRNKAMHLKKYPHLADEIEHNYQWVYAKQVLPSMRSMQFAGKPIELNNSRIYNCAYSPISQLRAFSESMFLLLGGTGDGFSVQRMHIDQLPPVVKPTKEMRFVVGDSIEGWSDAVKALVKAYLGGRKTKPKFDFRDIRPKGARLITSGGKAPGPQPLKTCLHQIEAILDSKEEGAKLRPIEVFDIICHIADAVLAGGIRRAALICLFDADDEEMLSAKSGQWWELNPQRGRANISAVIYRDELTEETFREIWKRTELSGAGEPGVYLSNSREMGANPCKPLDSTILTKDGYITFAQALEKNSLKVVLPSGEIVSATKPWKTGENRDVYEVLLSNGSSLLGTEDHKHQKRNGEWTEIKDLRPGDEFEVFYPKLFDPAEIVIEQEEYNKGLIQGWLFADGTNFVRGDGNGCRRAQLFFGVNEFDVAPLFESILGRKSFDHSQKPKTCKVMSLHQKEIPYPNKFHVPFGESPSFKLGFLRSVFTADGSVRRNNLVELYSIQKGVLASVCLLLSEFGVMAKVTKHSNEKNYIAKDGKPRNNKETYKVTVHGGQYKKIGFLSAFKQDLLSQQEETLTNYSLSRLTRVKVLEVRKRSVEDVYDITAHHPGHYFLDSGIITRQCVEIGLWADQFCNTTEINADTVESQEDFNQRARVAAFLGTLQAGYTDFHYLDINWKETTEEEALLGVSLTGICGGAILSLNESEAAREAVKENVRVAKLIGINPAARVTTIKPAGTTSLVLGTSSGIHAWFGKFYLRRMKVGKNEAIYHYLSKYHPELVEDDVFKPKEMAWVRVPQKAPKGAILRTEPAVEMLERVKRYYENWILPGHISGPNTHNVSATVNIKPEEWKEATDWAWENRDSYLGLAAMPYDGGTYVQAPFEEIDEDTYNTLVSSLRGVDLTEVVESEDNTDLTGELACGGGGCEVV